MASPGFRKIPNELWAAHKPKHGAKWSFTEMYLDYDQDVFQNQVVSVRAYAKRWGCHWRTASGAINAHKVEHLVPHSLTHDSPLETNTSATSRSTNGTPSAHEVENLVPPVIETDTETDTEREQLVNPDAEPEPDLWLDSEHRLTPKQVLSLSRIAPNGIKYTDVQISAWFVDKAPVMAAKGYKSLFRTAVNWWPRVTPEEVKAAEAAMENRRFLVFKAARAAPDLQVVEDLSAPDLGGFEYGEPI